MAHEIGHSLGALHDEDDNPCLKKDHYIMSPSLDFPDMANMQLFSSCSIQYFKNLLLDGE